MGNQTIRAFERERKYKRLESYYEKPTTAVEDFINNFKSTRRSEFWEIVNKAWAFITTYYFH